MHTIYDMPDDANRLMLRSRTGRNHAGVDRLFGGLDLAKPEGWATFLSAHHLAYQIVEQNDLPGYRRAIVLPLTQLIGTDLDALGQAVPEWEAPPDADLGHPLGATYVIAGSHFGQVLLRRRWAQSSDLRVRAANRYIESNQLRNLWGEVSVRIETVANEEELEAMVDGARRCFSLFERAFLECKVEERGELGG